MKIPFVDLRALHEEVRPEIETAFRDVFDRSAFVGGALVDTFEKNFAAYCGTRSAVACANWPPSKATSSNSRNVSTDFAVCASDPTG